MRPEDLGQLKHELKQEIMQGFSYQYQMTDEEVAQIIDETIQKRAQVQPVTLREQLKLQRELFDSFRRLDILQELVDDPAITEIMVNGPKEVFVESGGKLGRWDKAFESKTQLLDLIQQIVGRVNRIVNTSTPIVSARLPDDSRVHVVLEPIAINGPILTIRKFPEPMTMEKLLAYGSISEEAVELLKMLTAARYNIFVSGGTGAGKTSLLNALSEFIPGDERVVTIEDSAELNLSQINNMFRMETREANAEGEGAIGIGDLIRESLRMRPDRIVVGEVRGKEALDMLQALNTGHGGFSTGHGNSTKDMLSRLEVMSMMRESIPLLAIRSQIVSAIDIMVHVARMRDKSRKVVAIEEVDRIENGEIVLNSLFTFVETSEGKTSEKVEGRLQKTGTLKHQEKLRMAGYRL